MIRTFLPGTIWVLAMLAIRCAGPVTPETQEAAAKIAINEARSRCAAYLASGPRDSELTDACKALALLDRVTVQDDGATEPEGSAHSLGTAAPSSIPPVEGDAGP